MTAFAACSSDEPQGGEKEDNPTRVDTTAVPEDTIPNNDTVVPTDTFVPYDGPIDPLSDEIRPVLTDGKKWVMRLKLLGKGEVVYTYFVSGDSTVNGEPVKLVSMIRDDGTMAPGKLIYKEKDGLVMESYAVGINLDANGREEIQLGFRTAYNVYPFESFTENGLTVFSRGTMVLWGKTRRVAKVINGNRTDYWVEGMGPLFGLTVYFVGHPVTTGSVGKATLLECWDGDRKIYDYREFSDDLYHITDEF